MLRRSIIDSYLRPAHSRGSGGRADMQSEERASSCRQAEHGHWAAAPHVSVLYSCSSPLLVTAGLSKLGNSHFPFRKARHRIQDAAAEAPIPQSPVTNSFPYFSHSAESFQKIKQTKKNTKIMLQLQSGCLFIKLCHKDEREVLFMISIILIIY